MSRVRLPVTVEVTEQRFAPEIEASAYFVVAEALTNVAKHSGAASAHVRLWVERQRAARGRARRRGRRRPPRRQRPRSASPIASRHWEAACVVDSPPGEGTRIGATLPLQQG